ncbi:unnamed protein product [Leuciscus chuanchicus]
MSFSFRMSSGFPSPLNEEQTTIVLDNFSVLAVWMMDLHLAASAWDAPGLGVQPAGLSG